MKILFSPSETKFKGGISDKITQNSFIFPELYDKRVEILNRYQNFIDLATDEELSKLFGSKKKDVIEYYKGDLSSKKIMKVIERYDGVAFDYLKYNELDIMSKNYIDTNVMIFSNLFGPVLAGDVGLPDYKLKQGEKLNTLAVEKFYNEYFTKSIDSYLKDEEILDLRAGFYEKFYKINKPYTTMKFIKDGKVVSHWAKAYRGIVLNLIAKNNIQSIAQLMDMEIEKLSIVEIKQQKLKEEILYAIR